MDRIHRTDGMVEWVSPQGGHIIVREQPYKDGLLGVVVWLPWGKGDVPALLVQALRWAEVMGLDQLVVETTELTQVQELRRYGFALETQSVVSAVTIPPVAPTQAEAAGQEVEEQEEEPPPPPKKPTKVAKRRIAPAAPAVDHQGEQRTTRMQQGILPFAQNPRLLGPVLEGME